MVNVRCDEEEDEDYEVRKIAARVMAKAPGRQPETKREGFGSKIAQDIYDELEMEVNYVMEARGWAREAQTDSIEVCVNKLAEDQGVEILDHVQATMELLRDTIIYKKAEGRITAEKKRRAAVEEAKRRALTLTKWELGVVVVLAVLLPMRYFEDSSPMVHMIHGRFNLMTENLGDWLLDLFGLRSLVEGW